MAASSTKTTAGKEDGAARAPVPPRPIDNADTEHSVHAASEGRIKTDAPNGIDINSSQSTVGTILDPDINGSGSKYAARGTFGLGPAVRVYTPVTIGKSKTFMRADLKLAKEVVVVDASKANATSKDLYLILPEALDAGGLDGIATAYNALIVPMVDRDGLAFVWDIRRATRDGVQLQSYDSATAILPDMVNEWGRVQWLGSGYSLDKPYNPAALGEPKWPSNLRTFDDWVEAAFRGKIISTADHKTLQYLRAEI
jgi:hypothetical protein